MEQRFYKIRLGGGRVIGPVDLERIKLFILKGKITGLETARLYPTGDWKDINTYPEIADLLMRKLEGKLTPESTTATPAIDPGSKMSLTLPIAEEPPPSPTPTKVTASDSGLQLEEQTDEQKPRPKATTDDEKTYVMTADDERTVMHSLEEAPKAGFDHGAPLNAGDLENQIVKLVTDQEEEIAADPRIANEKTAMLSVPAAEKKKLDKKKKIFIAGAVLAAIVLALAYEPEDKKQNDSQAPFKIEMPAAVKADPSKSEKLFFEAIKFYSQDTVEGYKNAAKLFLKAASFDQNNVKALCLLASSYMNLIDVVPRDENYFNVVTRLIEMERAKGMDLAETVVADVELYHVLGNPDAAVNRIIEYSKTHPQFGIEMYYYLGLSFFLKGQYPEALKYLNSIDPKNYFSPKINLLFGLIYEKNEQLDEALKAFQDTIQRSPKQIKARVKLAELYFRRDNLPEAGKQADFVILNQNMASKGELAKAYYFRARMHSVASRDNEALQDLELALKNSPEDQDILLDYYTLKAKLGALVKDAQGKAKMFHFLALGEKAFKDGDLHTANVHYLSARDAQEGDPVPLMKIAEVFRKKGDLQSAKLNLGKALKVAPKNADIYPKYIKTLIDAYEFAEAGRVLSSFKELNPPVALFDRLQGDIYFKEGRYVEALSYFKRALASTNIESSIYISYANVMFKTGNYRDSAFYFGLAQRFDPFNVEATVGIGKSLAELENVETGVQFVQNALQLSPYKAALLNGTAEVYARKGDYASALKFAENALTTDPTFALAHKTRGDAYAALDKTKEALDAYLTYTNLSPLDPAGHIERYRIYLKKLDLKAAKAEIQKVIDGYPHYPGAYYMLGELYREGQNYQSALEAAQIEIKNNPGFVPAYVLAGQAYNLAHDYTNALVVLTKGLKLAPDYVPVLIQAGIANQNLKTYAAARSMYERAMTLDSGNPEVHKRLGTLFHDLGDFERSKQHFKAYLDLYPNAPDRSDIEALAK